MRLITITILTFAQSAFGGLIDLTPGGFNWSTATKPPPGFLQIGRDQHLAVPRLALFDTAIPSGWVSVPGVDLLNGGTYFDTDFPQLAPTATASLTWDFDGTIYSLRWILVEGDDANGNVWTHIYFAKGAAFENSGSALVTLNGIAPIGAISVYGRTADMPVPESGATLGLLLCGIVACAAFRRA